MLAVFICCSETDWQFRQCSWSRRSCRWHDKASRSLLWPCCS